MENQAESSLDTAASPTLDAIIANDISMVYESLAGKAQVLARVNLRVHHGQVQLLVGPSGSGRTTLLLILAGLLTPTVGEVSLLGHRVTHMSRRQLEKFRLRNLGFIAQDFNLFPALTAAENVGLVLRYKGIKGKVARTQTQDLLAQVGLADKGRFLPSQLSGGQKQRVAIARALGGNPSLIMADEPTASLDAESGHAVVDLLHQLTRQAGCTVLMVTHDPRIVDVADQVLELENGKILPAG
ncbi:MAG: ABC transporter ATP-binding protein [Thermosynechococcaceae cyanobacterium]